MRKKRAPGLYKDGLVLSELKRERIREAYKKGQNKVPRTTYMDLALRYDVSVQTIHNIVHEKPKTRAA